MSAPSSPGWITPEQEGDYSHVSGTKGEGGREVSWKILSILATVPVSKTKPCGDAPAGLQPCREREELESAPGEFEIGESSCCTVTVPCSCQAWCQPASCCGHGGNPANTKYSGITREDQKL